MDAHEEFIGLLLRHQGELRAFLRSLVRDVHVCEDLLQEIAALLWREFDRFDRSRSFGAWARGVAAKKLLQHWDKAGRIPIPFSPAAIQAIVEAFDRRELPQPHSAPQADALQTCVERLSTRARQLLTLRYDHAFGLPEIAARTGASLDAVHKALVRIRKQLRECVERHLSSAGSSLAGGAYEDARSLD